MSSGDPAKVLQPPEHALNYIALAVNFTIQWKSLVPLGPTMDCRYRGPSKNGDATGPTPVRAL